MSGIAMRRLGRLFPVLGLISNRLAYPGLHTGFGVELMRGLRYGADVRIGDATRLEIAPGGSITLGDGVGLSRSVHLTVGQGDELIIRAGTSVQDACRLYGAVRLGRGCLLAPNVFISSGTHVFNEAPHLAMREQERRFALPQRPVTIGDDCWIGINVAVMPGVSIGRGCVVGANSVVTRDLPPYSIAVGSPARVVKQRLSFRPPARIEALREEDTPYFYSGFVDSGGGERARRTDGSFVVSLDRAGATRLSLGVSGAGHVAFAGAKRTVGPGTEQVDFDLTHHDGSKPYFEVEATPGTLVHWAELS